MKQPTRVRLYSERASAALDLQQICSYVREALPPLEVEVRESFIAFHLGESMEEALPTMARRFAEAKVRNPSAQLDDFLPLPGEVDYEWRRLSDPDNKTWGILYDGYGLMAILHGLIPRAERDISHVHIVFTNQLFGTWEENDRRYHARVSVYGFPSIISTAGIVEAPAKPREYYLLKQQYAALGMADAAAGLEADFQGRSVSHDDERLTEVMKGYAMQAIACHLLGDPFCQDKGCRLYNAHWQEEVVHAQLESPYEFCPSHQRILQQLNEELA
jgi:hypothetical protein